MLNTFFHGLDKNYIKFQLFCFFVGCPYVNIIGGKGLQTEKGKMFTLGKFNKSETFNFFKTL